MRLAEAVQTASLMHQLCRGENDREQHRPLACGSEESENGERCQGENEGLVLRTEATRGGVAVAEPEEDEHGEGREREGNE